MTEKFNKTHKKVCKCNLLNRYKNVKQQVTIMYITGLHRRKEEYGKATIKRTGLILHCKTDTKFF